MCVLKVDMSVIQALQNRPVPNRGLVSHLNYSLLRWKNGERLHYTVFLNVSLSWLCVTRILFVVHSDKEMPHFNAMILALDRTGLCSECNGCRKLNIVSGFLFFIFWIYIFSKKTVKMNIWKKKMKSSSPSPELLAFFKMIETNF